MVPLTQKIEDRGGGPPTVMDPKTQMTLLAAPPVAPASPVPRQASAPASPVHPQAPPIAPVSPMVAQRQGPLPIAPASPVVINTQNTPPDSRGDDRIVTITVDKPTVDTRVGLAFRTTTTSGTNHNYVRVKAVAEDSLFGPQYQRNDDNTVCIEPGMKVLSINGQSVHSKEEAYSIIESITGRVTLVVERQQSEREEKKKHKKKKKKKHHTKTTSSSHMETKTKRDDGLATDEGESQSASEDRSDSAHA
eukprot:scaffold5944_cov101-Amphora_coffeaeformis.AAC.12